MAPPGGGSPARFLSFVTLITPTGTNGSAPAGELWWPSDTSLTTIAQSAPSMPLPMAARQSSAAAPQCLPSPLMALARRVSMDCVSRPRRAAEGS